MAHLKFRVPFFKDRHENLLQRVSETLEFQAFEKGDFLLSQGEMDDQIFIILKGKCQI